METCLNILFFFLFFFSSYCSFCFWRRMLNSSKKGPALPQNALKYEVCVDTLLSGCVGAFVQLFTLSHRDPVCVDELAQKMFSIPDDKLPWVQEALIAAELKRRRSDFAGVFEENMKLAQYFEECGDHEQAAKQHQIALQNCTESLDRGLEGEAHEAFGLFYERRKQIAEATLHHETRLKLSEIAGDAEARARAAKNLFRVYMARGTNEMSNNKPQEAKTFYEKAVVVAKSSRDPQLESQAYSALGNITVLLGDLQKALEYEKRFLVVSREAKNGHSESVAALKVAKLQETLGHQDEAIQSLRSALIRAEEVNDLTAVCDACRQLGEAYRNAGQPVKATHYFQQYFRVACNIGNERQIEKARIAYGFSLGESYFKEFGGDAGYIGIVCDDMATQLEWMSGGHLL